MLTSAKPKGKYANILMDPIHFEEGYEFNFSNTHFVNQIFIKLQDWGPFYLAGRLTEEGINFIETNLTHRKPIEFEEYINS